MNTDAQDLTREEEGNVPLGEGYRRVRRSAAVVGLAVSMGAPGMFFSQNAAAATGSGNSPLVSVTDLSPENAPREQTTLTPLALKHQVGNSALLPAAALSSPLAPATVTKPQAQAIVADVSRPMPGTVTPPPLEEKLTSQKIQATAANAGLQLNSPNSLPSPVEVAAAHADGAIPITVVAPEEYQTVEVQPARQSGMPQSSSLPALPVASPAPSKAQRDQELPSGESISLDSLRQNGMAQPVPPLETALNIDEPVAIAVVPPQTEPTFTSRVGAQPVAKVAMPTTPQVVAPTTNLTGGDSYQVKSGDTLNQIARRFEADPQEIQRANGLDNPNSLKVHQILVIPPAETTVAALPPVSSPLPSVVTRAPEPVQAVQETIIRQNQDPAQQAVGRFQQQLKAEVTQLNQTQPPSPNAQPMVVASRPTVEEVNPDWQSRPVAPEVLPAQPRQDLAQLQRQYAPRGERVRFSTSPTSSQPQVIGAAPAPVEQYNQSIQLSVIQEVSPELPGLNTPNFPRGQGQFNGYIWPARGVFTSGYGPRWGRMHRGIDIAGPIGTPIMAAAPGEVIFSGWNSGGFGNLVKVRHGDGSVTYYAHNHRLLVRKGDYVEQGQQIAEMGSTGRSTGPHLHFEIRVGGTNAVNPVALLPRSR